MAEGGIGPYRTEALDSGNDVSEDSNTLEYPYCTEDLKNWSMMEAGEFADIDWSRAECRDDVIELLEQKLNSDEDNNGDITFEKLEYPYCTEDLKNWSMIEACKFAEKNHIDWSRAECRDDVIELLEQKLDSDEDNNGDITSKKFNRKIQDDSRRYEENIEKVTGYLKEAREILTLVEKGDVITDSLTTYFERIEPDHNSRNTSISELQAATEGSQCAVKMSMRDRLNTKLSEVNMKIDIAVIGAEGAGKSSIINCLIGGNVLPTDSALHCTKTIIRVCNDEKRKIVIKKKDGTEESLDILYETDLRNKLTEMNCDLDSRYIDVHWPVPFLHKNLVIVHTPGNNATEETKKFVSDFLPSATAVIVMIDTPARGGFPVDVARRIKELSDKRDPKSVFFVYNKWDCIQKDDRQRILEDNESKIIEHFGTFIDENVVTIDAKMATRKVGEKIFFSRNFRRLLDGLSQLIGTAYTTSVLSHSFWISCFTHELKVFLEIARPGRSIEGRKKMKKQYRRKADEIIQKAGEKCKEIADYIEKTHENEGKKLLAHLKSPETLSRIVGDERIYSKWTFFTKRIIKSIVTNEINDWLKEDNAIHCLKEYVSEEVNTFASEIDETYSIHGDMHYKKDSLLPVLFNSTNAYLAATVISVFAARLFRPLIVVQLFIQVGAIVNEIKLNKKQVENYTEEFIESFTLDKLTEMTKQPYDQIKDAVEFYLEKEIPGKLSSVAQLAEAMATREEEININVATVQNLTEELAKKVDYFVQLIQSRASST